MPGTYLCRIVLSVLALISNPALTCASDLNSLAQRLAGDAADGRFDQFSLLEAAIIAGGENTSSEVAEAVAQFERGFNLF